MPLGPGGCCDRQPLRRHSPAAVFSTASRVCDVTSDVLVAPAANCPPRPKPRRTAARAPDPLPPQPRQRQRHSRARTPSIDECSLRLLARGIVGSPPPFSRFRHRDPASGARSPLCWRETRPVRFGRKARCRSSTSAIHAIREHDRTIVRTPVERVAASLRAVSPLVQAALARVPGEGAIPVEVSRARGRAGFRLQAPSVAIARDGSFAPTRSARTPHVVSSARRWPEKPAPPRCPR